MKVRFLHLCVLLLLAGRTVHAQYSEAAFEQKQAGELYDERGFMHGKAITVDGKLVVSNSNGNVSYSYPLTSWKESGYGFSASLNYCGSVAFTTFGEYTQENIDNPYSMWSRFTQNRPVWLIGVNGFAVQALSVTTSFHADPAWITGRYENTSVTSFDDEDMVWAIDGYDVCNRMQDFGAGVYQGGGSGPNIYRDVIRLLRADGSVLELKNTNYESSNIGANTDWNSTKHLYSGYYVVNEANAPGYAYVEFQTEDDPYYHPEYLSYLPDLPSLTPRKVRYYPGDGLEYLFIERFNAYGTQEILDPLAQYGGAEANPTIFYLSEIRSAGERLVGFSYARHNIGSLEYDFSSAYSATPLYDSTRGRALLVQFGDNTITYGNSGLVIEADGRSTLVQYDTVAASGNAEANEAFPLASYGYYNSFSEGLSRIPLTNDGLYDSWLGYVTKIIDPEGRETTFDYEEYERRYVNFGWPRATGSGPNLTVALKNYRLNEVVEPTATYTMKYHNRSGGLETLDSDGLDTLTVGQGAVGDYPFAFSNSLRLLQKRNRGATLLSESTYDFFFENALISTTPTGALVSIEDKISGHHTTTAYVYKSDTLPRAISILNPMEPTKRRTQLYTVASYGITNGVITDSSLTLTNEAAVTDGTRSAPYLWLPTSRTSSVNGCVQSIVVYHYGLDTVRRYGGRDSVIKYHGMEINLKEELILNPLSGLHLIDSTRYLNVPEVDTTVTVIRDSWKKLEMYRKFDSLRAIGDPAVVGKTFLEVAYDPRILTIASTDTVILGAYRVPPLFGLVQEQWQSDANGNYLAGKKNNYCLFGDCDAPTTIWIEELDLHGALLSDTLYGRGRVSMPGKSISYEDFKRGKPSLVENVLGAKVRTHYNYRYPGMSSTESPEGLVIANDNAAYLEELPNGSYFSERYELPQSQRAEVRKYDPLLSLFTDTLTTISEHTYFGQVRSTIDPNGYLSRYDYDYNGRLNTAWLPFDFQSPDSIYQLDVEGLEYSSGYGNTVWKSVYDTVWCGGTLPGFAVETTHWSPALFTNRPMILVPKCGGGYDTLSQRERKGPSTQTTGNANLPYMYDTAAKGSFSFTVKPPKVDEILRLDSAFVDLYVSRVVGSCVTVKFLMPAFTTFEKTYVLNCEQTGSQPSPDTLSDVVRLQIPLTGFLDSIENETVITFTVETTTMNAAVHFVNDFQATDGREPRLLLYGEFRKKNELADYTLHYAYDDENLTSRITAKIDDSLHTANLGVGGITSLGEPRRTSTTHYFGADYRLLKTKTPIGEMNSPTRYDSVLASYDGLGQVLTATDQEGDVVTTRYDAWGRADTTWNQDGTYSTVDYYYCCYDPVGNVELNIDPSYCYDFTQYEQDFYGFVKAKVVTNELGKKFVQYFDAFDQLRRDVADSGGLHRVTKYEYDIAGRVKRVTNPAGDETEYWYDDFGRVLYKSQPDLGTISYAYDDLGNVRFTQTQEQEYEDRITFNEYDDLNRLVIVGEADFFDHQSGIGTPSGKDQLSTAVTGDVEKSLYSRTALSVPTDDTLNLDRLTDQLDPNILHDDSLSAILTANKTLWMALNTYGNALPAFWSDLDSIPETCEDMNMAVPEAIGPFLKHEANVYEPTVEISDYDDFENLAKHPENLRIAIHYDDLPYSAGAAFETFPQAAAWDSLAPHGKVRNLKGREAAVAYREHGGEPFHYSVISYDERGRPEALLRYTENLGFDAIYYAYNSMNQLIAVTVADPYRQFATWYGYDDNGRLDSVWTKLSEAGYGLKGYDGSQAKYPTVEMSRPQSAEITYVYTKTGQVDSMFYPAVSVAVDYRYSPRKWLDTLKATKGGSDLFTQYLTFNAGGQITYQSSSHSGGYPLNQEYTYDGISQLTQWKKQYGGIYGWTREVYDYDPVGNRDSLTYITNVSSQPYPKDYYDNGRGSSTPGVGPNQLLKVTQPSGDYTDYAYDRNGSMTSRKDYTSTNALTKEERFSYSSWRNLPWSYEREDPTITVGPNVWEYRYRYNAQGEREQKREWLTPPGDVTAPGYAWTYYLLGGSKKQMSVWKGMQTSESGFCGDTGTGSNVYLYPVEYLTYGGYAASLTTRPSGTMEYRIADHLGSNRVVLDNTGTVLSTTDYAPFGKPVAGNEDRKSWIDRESDVENELGNFGLRNYLSDEGRFCSVDALWENYRSTSPYQYGLNNVMSFVDPSGDSAWKYTNDWNDGFIQAYKRFVYTQAEVYQENEQEFTCEDFALSILIDFASKNGLPVKIENGSGTYDAASSSYKDISTFKRDVLTTTAASDLQNSKNTLPSTTDSPGAGDLLVLRNSKGVAHHIQVAGFEIGSLLYIYQGNSGMLNGVPGASSILDASNPESSFYTGTEIQFGVLNLQTGSYNREGNTINNFYSSENVETRAWNFSSWKR